MTSGKRVKEILKNGEFVPAKLSGIPQSTISGMESGRINIGVERAKVLAKALRVHPAVIVFPGWEVGHAS
ncbi:MAG TPA: helix-turn-helix transcriptional regulator [Pseudobdellovibrionaceae bacterium]|nr:helix-turn-helix transcriptional regulator [Pseudobdellovibrionaceae bacterium]